MNQRRKGSLFSLFFTFAIDNLGATIVFPLFAPLFLDQAESVFSPSTSLAFKSTLLGLFLGIFPCMQLLFAPIFGEIADHYGRKRALILTTAMTFLGYLLTAVGIHQHTLSLLFIGRMTMGLGSGNLTISLSSLSDLSRSAKQKDTFYAIGSAICGLTFILGPFIGGKLSDPLLSPLFSLSFPLFVGASLALLNLLFVIFSFEETLKEIIQGPLNLFRSLTQFSHLLKIKSLNRLYLVYFFYLFSCNITLLFIPAIATEKFQFSNSKIGDLCALLGALWIVGTALLHRLLIPIKNRKALLLGSFLLFALLILLGGVASELKTVLLLLGISSMIAGLIWPLSTLAISKAVSKKVQGKALGLSQSMLAFSMILASILGGLSLQVDPLALFILSSVSSLLAGMMLIGVKAL